jgi:hypothetical protein
MKAILHHRDLGRLLAIFALMLFGGCATTPSHDYTPAVARFYLESTDARSATITLPQSGVQVAVASQPVLTETDITNVEVAKVELGECLMFQLTSAATRDLYRLTGSNQGRRLVLTLNGMPLGARRIEQPLADGAVLIFVEVPDSDLPALVARLKKTSADLQRAAARKKS